MNQSADKIHYFGAGPAALPQSAIDGTAAAVRKYGVNDLSLLEIEHRGKDFGAILEESIALIKELCGLEDDYEVMWQQGGGRLQFCTVPMNYLGEKETAAYIDSGHWAHTAMEAAKYYGNVRVLASSRENNYTRLPILPDPLPADGYGYLHLTTNNTIYGTQFLNDPDSSVPVIADMSSDILGQPRDYRKYAMFYAVAQKNIGAAGATLVAIRKDFIDRQKRALPDMLSYSAHAKANSLLNTPPVAAIYTAMLTLRWLKEQGTEHVYEQNRMKAELMYKEVERNSCFRAIVDEGSRSRMNVVFHGLNEEMEKQFLQFARERSITGIAGHRSVGGFRASVYNAVSLTAVHALLAAMQEFEQKTN